MLHIRKEQQAVGPGELEDPAGGLDLEVLQTQRIAAQEGLCCMQQASKQAINLMFYRSELWQKELRLS
jgi:hypothetical protein